MPEHDARHGFNFDVAHGVALNLCEVADLLLGELDVGDGLAAERRHAAIDLGGAQAVSVAIPAVEADAEFTDGGVAAGLYIGENAFHGLADMGVALLPVACGGAVFQVYGHGMSVL